MDQNHLTYNEWNNLRIKELNSMYEANKITDIDFQKIMLMFTKNLYIPFPHPENEDDEIYQNDIRIHRYISEINDAVDRKIINKEFLVSSELYEKAIHNNYTSANTIDSLSEEE